MIDQTCNPMYIQLNCQIKILLSFIQWDRGSDKRDVQQRNESTIQTYTTNENGPQGEVVRVSALFDGAAIMAVMCLSIFKKVKHRLGIWKESKKLLQMANRTVVLSQAVWRGVMQLGDIKIEGSFEVFDSRGSWAFLLGKPLLHLFKAKQDFAMHTVTICSAQGLNLTILCNEIAQPRPGNNTIQMNLTLDIKQVMKESESILKRQTDPWKPEHVARLLKEVTLG